MNVCIVTSARYPPEEGIGNFTYNLSRELIRKGNQVTIITRGGFHRRRRSSYDGIELYEVPFVPLYPFHVFIHGLFVQKLLRSISSGFDVIHFHTPLPPAVQTSIPTVTTVHTPMKADTRSIELTGPYTLAIKLQCRISCLTEQSLFRLTDKITAVSTSVSAEMAEYGIDPREVAFIGNGVDEKLFRPADRKRDEKYILYVGRLSFRKGIFDFIESCKIIGSRRPDVKFKIVGKGQLYEKALAMVENAEHRDRFEFLRHVDRDRLIDLYQNATVFVLPSHYEGLPTTLLEAMACGIPVVATAVSGNLDVVEPEKNGILVPARSPREIASAVASLLESDKLRADLGTSARKTIEGRFTWDSISDRIIDCYKSVLEGSGRS